MCSVGVEVAWGWEASLVVSGPPPSLLPSAAAALEHIPREEDLAGLRLLGWGSCTSFGPFLHFFCLPKPLRMSLCVHTVCG